MKIEKFVKIINSKFYTGVPDSQLKPLCNYLIDKYGIDYKHHIIAANEGNAVALAAGYYLSTKKFPVVYLQNSGLGNIVNPVASLLNDKVYAIPVIFVIGWRGEPNIKDEPQHIFQGEITEKLLKDLNIEYFIISSETSDKEVEQVKIKFNNIMNNGKSVAFLVKKDALSFDKKVLYKNLHKITREEIIKYILKFSKKSPIISTTGKTSRELFEIRNINNQEHKYDFLTVGSMGHCSSIALSIALNKPKTKVWCIEGDGSALMHLGAMSIIGASNPKNLVHVVINNSSHESVGGMPTVAENISFTKIAHGCGYKKIIRICSIKDINKKLHQAELSKELTFVEILSAIGSRSNLGRPTLSTIENKKNFMNYINNLK